MSIPRGRGESNTSYALRLIEQNNRLIEQLLEDGRRAAEAERARREMRESELRRKNFRSQEYFGGSEEPSNMSDLPSTYPNYQPKKARKPQSPAWEFSECNMCGKEAKGQCNNCGKAKYCSRKCQAKHWVAHKVECLAE